MYYSRTLEKILLETSASFPAVLVTGPRQVGKSTLLEHCADGERHVVSLDHPAVRALARTDPELFFQAHPPPILIDEVQYAPELFPFIKILSDRAKKPGLFWMTGSQQFSMMKNVSESLAGRVAILDLLGLSRSELSGRANAGSFLDALRASPRRHANPVTLKELYRTILRGSFPALYERTAMKTGVFYSSYVKTYLERDIRSVLNLTQESAFLRFLTVVAARTAQTVNYSDMSRDLGLAPNTVRSWLSILESSRLIYLLRPYHANFTSRAVKTPKLYFTDTGLCAHLTGWTTPETIESGAMNGALLETFVVMEIVKSFWHRGLEAPVYFYRDKEKREIDMLVEADGLLHPVEVKKTAKPTPFDIRHFALLDAARLKRGIGAVVCLTTERAPLARDVKVMNIGDI